MEKNKRKNANTRAVLREAQASREAAHKGTGCHAHRIHDWLEFPALRASIDLFDAGRVACNPTDLARAQSRCRTRPDADSRRPPSLSGGGSRGATPCELEAGDGQKSPSAHQGHVTRGSQRAYSDVRQIPGTGYWILPGSSGALCGWRLHQARAIATQKVAGAQELWLFEIQGTLTNKIIGRLEYIGFVWNTHEPQ